MAKNQNPDEEFEELIKDLGNAVRLPFKSGSTGNTRNTTAYITRFPADFESTSGVSGEGLLLEIPAAFTPEQKTAARKNFAEVVAIVKRLKPTWVASNTRIGVALAGTLDDSLQKTASVLKKYKK